MYTIPFCIARYSTEKIATIRRKIIADVATGDGEKTGVATTPVPILSQFYDIGSYILNKRPVVLYKQ